MVDVEPDFVKKRKFRQDKSVVYGRLCICVKQHQPYRTYHQLHTKKRFAAV